MFYLINKEFDDYLVVINFSEKDRNETNEIKMLKEMLSNYNKNKILYLKEQLENELNNLSEKWSISDKFLICRYEFQNFIDALSFMNKVGVKCEEMDHHPKWTNVYNRLEIELFTHDKDGLTIKDFDLAVFMDQEFESYE